MRAELREAIAAMEELRSVSRHLSQEMAEVKAAAAASGSPSRVPSYPPSNGSSPETTSTSRSPPTTAQALASPGGGGGGGSGGGGSGSGVIPERVGGGEGGSADCSASSAAAATGRWKVMGREGVAALLIGGDEAAGGAERGPTHAQRTEDGEGDEEAPREGVDDESWAGVPLGRPMRGEIEWDRGSAASGASGATDVSTFSAAAAALKRVHTRMVMMQRIKDHR